MELNEFNSNLKVEGYLENLLSQLSEVLEMEVYFDIIELLANLDEIYTQENNWESYMATTGYKDSVLVELDNLRSDYLWSTFSQSHIKVIEKLMPDIELVDLDVTEELLIDSGPEFIIAVATYLESRVSLSDEDNSDDDGMLN